MPSPSDKPFSSQNTAVHERVCYCLRGMGASYVDVLRYANYCIPIRIYGKPYWNTCELPYFQVLVHNSGSRHGQGSEVTPAIPYLV